MVDGEHSDHIHVDSGVPQGTMMGPLLFLLLQRPTSACEVFRETIRR